MRTLSWDSSTRGHTLPKVAESLTMAELDFWIGRLANCPWGRGILQAEADRRDPTQARGTLWEVVK